MDKIGDWEDLCEQVTRERNQATWAYGVPRERFLRLMEGLVKSGNRHAKALKVAREAVRSSACRCQRINWQSPEYIICRRCRAIAELDSIAEAACRE